MATSPEKNSKGPKIRIDEFIGNVVPDPAKNDKFILYKGYIGKSSVADHIRIYFDLALNSHVDIPVSGVAYAQEMSAEESAIGGSYVWLRTGTEIIYGDPEKEIGSITDFFEGQLVNRFKRKINPLLSNASDRCTDNCPTSFCSDHCPSTAACPSDRCYGGFEPKYTAKFMADYSSENCSGSCPSNNCTNSCPSTNCTSGCPSTNCTNSCPSTNCTSGCPSTNCTDSCPSTNCTSGCPSTNCTDSCPSTSCTDACPSRYCSVACPSTRCTDFCLTGLIPSGTCRITTPLRYPAKYMATFNPYICSR